MRVNSTTRSDLGAGGLRKKLTSKAGEDSKGNFDVKDNAQHRGRIDHKRLYHAVIRKEQSSGGHSTSARYDGTARMKVG